MGYLSTNCAHKNFDTKEQKQINDITKMITNAVPISW